jgi:putative membrane protein
MLASSLVVFAVLVTIGGRRAWRSGGPHPHVRWRPIVAFAAGWLALAAALVSPLDEWSETLFVAHMAQHELLMVVAAPLMALSGPLVALLWALPAGLRRGVVEIAACRPIAAMWAVMTAPPIAWLLHAVALWVWHLPSLYEVALEHEAIHAVQHLCFFGTAGLFWWGLVHGRYGRLGYGAAVLYLFATGLHSGMLGALIGFSPQVLYSAYASTSQAWGLTPLEDQQLAGFLMWVPAGLVFAAGGLWFFAAWVLESGRRARVAACVLMLVAAGGSTACQSVPDQLQQIDEALTSLRATLDVTGQAWHSGQVSRPYVRTALQETLRLLQQERDRLTASPALLADPRGAELSQRAEQLSRDAAQLWQASQR